MHQVWRRKLVGVHLYEGEWKNGKNHRRNSGYILLHFFRNSLISFEVKIFRVVVHACISKIKYTKLVENLNGYTRTQIHSRLPVPWAFEWNRWTSCENACACDKGCGACSASNQRRSSTAQSDHHRNEEMHRESKKIILIAQRQINWLRRNTQHVYTTNKKYKSLSSSAWVV